MMQNKIDHPFRIQTEPKYSTHGYQPASAPAKPNGQPAASANPQTNPPNQGTGGKK